MRISDWSSDVCSSDLDFFLRLRIDARHRAGRERDERQRRKRGGALPQGEAAFRRSGGFGRVGHFNLSRGREPSRLINPGAPRSEEHTSELQSLMRISYAVFGLKKTH